MNNMDTNMEDVVKIPEPQLLPQIPLDPPTIPILDSWIKNLMDCKQLAETDVQRLCEKVCICRPWGVARRVVAGSVLNDRKLIPCLLGP